MRLSAQLKPKHEHVSTISLEINLTSPRETVAMKHETVQNYAQHGKKILSSFFLSLNGYSYKETSNSLKSLLSQCQDIKVWLVIHMQFNTFYY